MKTSEAILAAPTLPGFDPERRVYLDFGGDRNALTLCKRQFGARFDYQRQQWFVSAAMLVQNHTTLSRWLPIHPTHTRYSKH